MGSNGVVVTGWDGLPVARSLDEFAAGVRKIRTLIVEWEFRLGEWLNKNKEMHGDLIWQWVDELPYTHAQISNFMWVAKEIGDQYTPEIRWSWWQSMAAIPAEERDPVITLALAGKIDREGIRALGHRNGSAGLKTQTAAIPTARDLAAENFGLAMAVCAKLMKYGDEDNLKEALDDLIAKAMILRELL